MSEPEVEPVYLQDVETFVIGVIPTPCRADSCDVVVDVAVHVGAAIGMRGDDRRVFMEEFDTFDLAAHEATHPGLLPGPAATE